MLVITVQSCAYTSTMGSNGHQSVETLRANYKGPSDAKEFSRKTAAGCPRNPTTEQKTAYLAELRKNVKQVQQDINIFLTEKMSEDKTRQGEADKKAAKTKDEIEEELYGEEQPEED